MTAGMQEADRHQPDGRPSSRLRTLASWTFAVTVVQVAIGGFTRGSDSGFGCKNRWPLCEDGLLGGVLPRPEFHMVVEWTHRWVASVAILMVAATAVYTWLHHRREGAILWAANGALAAILVQAVLGAVVVMSELQTDLVSVHLTVAMILVGLLAFVVTASLPAAAIVIGRPPSRDGDRDRERVWRRQLGVAAGASYAVIVLGSLVHDQYVGGWPLLEGRLVPELSSRLQVLHLSHRLAAGATLAYLGWLAMQAVRSRRPRAETVLVHGGLLLIALNVGLGAAHVFTQVQSTGLVVAHLLVATLAWSALVAATTVAHRLEGAAASAVEPETARLAPPPAGVEAGA